MKRKLNLTLIISMISFAAVAAITGSVAWFTPTASISKDDNKVDGSTLGAYFAYGNGTPTSQEHPNDNVYGITNPRHLYNLAWLQYLGFFNKPSENGKQYYFELADNIDMTGWVLPPIGTDSKPFIGNFSGNGFVVSNLTISNKFSDYDKHPSDVNATNYVAPHIIGFFGVIGDYNNEFGGTDYSSATNEFSNTGLTGLTIHTYLNDTLMGIAAGYVSGEMNNIAVDASTINIDQSISGNTTAFGNFTNISDFSLVGYTTHTKSVKKIDETIYAVNIDSDHQFNAVEQGEGETGWGGSINMKTIYQRLYGIKKYKYTSETLNHRINYSYYDNVENTNERTTRTNSAMYFYHGYNASGHEYIGNYSFYNRGSDYDQFMYLSGGHYESYTYRTNTVHTGYRISDGTNYMTYSGTGTTVGNTTTANNGTLWAFVEISTNVYYIQYKYQSATYNRYLYNNNGSLAVGTGTPSNTNARWTVTKSGNDLTITSLSDSTKKIYCSDGNWALIRASGTESYYVIQSGTHYISAASTSGSAVTNADSLDAAAHMEVDNNNRVYFVNNNSQTVYLTAYRPNNGTPSLRCNTNATANRYYVFTYSGGTLSAYRNNNSSYYVRYNNGWTVAENNNYNIALTEISFDYSSLYLRNTLDSGEATSTGPDYYQTTEDTTKSSNESHMYYTYSDTTYFPLNVNNDGGSFTSANTVNNAINGNNFDPRATNTGYITAGSDYSNRDANITSNNGSTYRDDISKVRISEYGISNINGSFSTNYNTLEKFLDSGIYTINTSGTKRTMAQEYNENTYPRYAESKKTFYTGALTTAYNQNNKTYTVADDVYGMHFLNSSINMNTIVNARNVSILNQKADSYQLPVNAVDFNLKQKGVVNFFAGTYFTGNNSFFSLHEIFRNDDASPKSAENEFYSYNTIANIKEIEEIYTTDVGSVTSKYANIYKYKGATGSAMYSVPYRLDVEQNKYKMNMSSTLDNNTPYTYDTMNQADFNTYQATYGYQLRFKTSQIGVNNSITKDNTIFYYEFPMNQGEYCLGSVDGGTGAYLLYLDIGANASKYQRTIFYERFDIAEKTFIRPDGVALVSLPDPSTYAKETPVIDISVELDCEDSACVRILPGAKQTYEIDRNNNDVTLTRTNQSNAPPVYAGELVTIHEINSSTPIEPSYTSSVTKLIKRMTYYDFNVNMGTLMTTVFTDTSTDGGSSYSRTIVQTIYPGTNDQADPTSVYTYDPSQNLDERDQMKVFNTSNGIQIDSSNMINPNSLVIDSSQISDDDILTVRIIQQGNGTYKEVISIHATVDETNLTYYLYDRTIVTITTSEGTVTIKVVALDSGTEIYYGTTKVTSVGQVITITA